MVYIVTGCLYVMMFGLSVAFRQIVLGEDVLPFKTYGAGNGTGFIEKQRSPSQDDSLSQVFDLIDKTIPDTVQDAAGINGHPLSAESFHRYNAQTAFDTEEKTELMFGILVTRTLLLVLLYYTAVICIGMK